MDTLSPVVDFSAIESCGELSAEHAEAAVASRDAMRKLLARIAQIARPMEGCPKVMLVVGRLARGDVTWVSGAVSAELTDDEGTTLLSIVSDVGDGLCEPVFPSLRLDAPLDEFVRAAKLAPKMMAPLVAEESAGKLSLSVPARAAASADHAFDLDDPFAEHEAPTRPAAQGPGQGAAVPAPPPSSPVAGPLPGGSADPVHTRPTVRRMVAIDPAMFAKRRDPRREDDE